MSECVSSGVLEPELPELPSLARLLALLSIFGGTSQNLARADSYTSVDHQCVIMCFKSIILVIIYIRVKSNI